MYIMLFFLDSGSDSASLPDFVDILGYTCLLCPVDHAYCRLQFGLVVLSSK